ncbi:Translin, partial [Araneus ventricosus]
MQKVPGSKAR